MSWIWCFSWSSVPNRTSECLISCYLSQIGKVELTLSWLRFLLIKELIFTIVKYSTWIRQLRNILLIWLPFPNLRWRNLFNHIWLIELTINRFKHLRILFSLKSFVDKRQIIVASWLHLTLWVAQTARMILVQQLCVFVFKIDRPEVSQVLGVTSWQLFTEVFNFNLVYF
jgi:hypothetical protein